jgi:hypothetical protein
MGENCRERQLLVMILIDVHPNSRGVVRVEPPTAAVVLAATRCCCDLRSRCSYCGKAAESGAGDERLVSFKVCGGCLVALYCSQHCQRGAGGLGDAQGTLQAFINVANHRGTTHRKRVW